MDFGANKMPVEVIKEGAFGGTYFRDKKLYKKSMEKMQSAKDIDQGFIVQIIMITVLINMVLSAEYR